MNAADDGGRSVDGRREFGGIAFFAIDACREVLLFIVIVLFLVKVVSVITKHHAFSKRSHVVDVCAVEHHGQFVAVDFLAGCDDGCAGFSVDMVVGLVFLPQSDEHGFTAVGAHQGHGCVGFGFEIAVCEDAVDLTLERGGYAFNDFGEGFFSLEKGQYEGSVDVVS